MGTGLVPSFGERVERSAPAWMGSPSGTSVTGQCDTKSRIASELAEWRPAMPEA